MSNDMKTWVNTPVPVSQCRSAPICYLRRCWLLVAGAGCYVLVLEARARAREAGGGYLHQFETQELIYLLVCRQGEALLIYTETHTHRPNDGATATSSAAAP
jgi:hypothetical protein